MFIAIYRWQVKAGQVAQFEEAWLTLTRAIYSTRGSLGSRLHKAQDGTWLAYAQWPDKATYDKAFSQDSADQAASALMRSCIESSEPPLFLEVVADYLQSVSANS